MKTSLRLPALFSTLCLLAAPASGQDHRERDMEQMHRLHRDPAAYIAMLEDPARDEYQKPEQTLDALELKAGETIADIGAGSGYFAFRIAKRVGATGRVYAVDISPEMVVHLNRRIRDAGVDNVTTVLAEPSDPLLPARSIDRFFVCDTWHHIENRSDYLDKIRAALKPDGEIVIVDFHKRELPFGPPPAMKIARDDVIGEMRQNGFRLSREFDFLPYQYFLVFKAQAE